MCVYVCMCACICVSAMHMPRFFCSYFCYYRASVAHCDRRYIESLFGLASKTGGPIPKVDRFGSPARGEVEFRVERVCVYVCVFVCLFGGVT